MEVKLGLERRRILVLGGLKPPGHGDAGRNWAGGLSEAGAAWHVSRSEAKQCDSAPALLLLLALPVLLCTHRGCPYHPSLPCVQTSLAARKQRALLPASDRFSAFGAELALVGDWVGGSPHSDPTSLPPLQLRRQIRECRSYITPPPAQMNVVGVAGGIVLSIPESKQLRPQVGATDPKQTEKVLCNCTY